MSKKTWSHNVSSTPWNWTCNFSGDRKMLMPLQNNQDYLPIIFLKSNVYDWIAISKNNTIFYFVFLCTSTFVDKF